MDLKKFLEMTNTIVPNVQQASCVWVKASPKHDSPETRIREIGIRPSELGEEYRDFEQAEAEQPQEDVEKMKKKKRTSFKPNTHKTLRKVGVKSDADIEKTRQRERYDENDNVCVNPKLDDSFITFDLDTSSSCYTTANESSFSTSDADSVYFDTSSGHEVDAIDGNGN